MWMYRQRMLQVRSIGVSEMEITLLSDLQPGYSVKFFVNGCYKGRTQSSPHAIRLNKPEGKHSPSSIYCQVWQDLKMVMTIPSVSFGHDARAISANNIPTKLGNTQVKGQVTGKIKRNYWQIVIPDGHQARFELLTSGSKVRLMGSQDQFPTENSYTWQTKKTQEIQKKGTWLLSVDGFGQLANYFLRIFMEPITQPQPLPQPQPQPHPQPLPQPSNDNVGTKYGLIVGISDYSQISDLSYCDEDATDWYRYLASRGYQIRLYGDTHKQNYPAYNGLATETNVREAFRQILQQAKVNDTVVFITSGHGSGDGKGNSYLCMYGCNPDQEIDCYTDKELLADIKSSPNKPKIVIFIDHCFSGGMLDELKDIPNVACLTTCTQNGYGYDNAQQQNGAWTYCYLQKGLIEQFKGQGPVQKVFEWSQKAYPTVSGNTDAGDQPQMINNLGPEFFI